MVGNLMAHQVERNPLSRAREFVFVNNLVYDRVTMELDLQSEDGPHDPEFGGGQRLHAGPQLRAAHPADLRAHLGHPEARHRQPGILGRRFRPGIRQLAHPVVAYTGGNVISGLMQTATMPVWNTGLTARKTANNAVYNRVLQLRRRASHGPRHRRQAHRAHVKSRSGGIINCVASNGTTRCNQNAGGWPCYAQNTRTLTLPSNPNGMASNGYTNLENWLHSMDLTVQGATSSPARRRRHRCQCIDDDVGLRTRPRRVIVRR